MTHLGYEFISMGLRGHVGDVNLTELGRPCSIAPRALSTHAIHMIKVAVTRKPHACAPVDENGAMPSIMDVNPLVLLITPPLYIFLSCASLLQFSLIYNALTTLSFNIQRTPGFDALAPGG